MDELILLNAKVNNTNIEQIIKDAGIEYPHESLGFFKAVYASIDDKPNKNKVRLAPSVKQDVGKLTGCQANFEHYRAGHICGTILHAYVNKKEEIEIVFSFYKSVYPNEYEYAIELMNSGDLNVSFELKADKEDIEALADGTRRVNRCQFDGVGVLMYNPPAYPDAHVFENAKIDLLRQQDLVFAKMMTSTTTTKPTLQQFNGSYWSAKYINALPDFCFAVIEPDYLEGKTTDKRCRHLPYKNHNGHTDAKHYKYALRKVDTIMAITDSITKEELIEKAQYVLNKIDVKFNKEEIQVDKKANDKLLAKLKEEVIAEFGEEAIKDWTDDDYTAEKIQALRDSLKSDEEAVEETPAVASTEEVVDDEPVEVVEEEPVEVVEEEAGDKKTEEIVVKEEINMEQAEETPVEEVVEEAQTEKTTETRVYEITDNDDGSMEVSETVTSESEVDGEIVRNETVTRKTVYAQEKLDAMKADYEEQIAKLKDSAKFIAELRVELGDYAKDLSDDELLDEDKVEIAKLKKENDELKKSKDSVEVDASTKEEIVATGHDEEASDEDNKVSLSAYIKKRHKSLIK